MSERDRPSIGQISAFFATVCAIWLSGHVFVSWRLAAPIPFDEAPWLAIVPLTLLLAAFTPFTLIFTRNAASGTPAFGWKLAGYIYMGFFCFLFTCTAMKDAAWLLASLVPGLAAAGLGKMLSVGAIVAALVLSAVALVGGLREPPHVKVEIAFEGLPPELDGLRIVQLSDIHVGAPLAGSDLARFVERTNALAPDLIAITGDLVDGSVAALGPEVECISQLSAPLGVYFVTGNHEYFSGAKNWERFIAAQGVEVLTNAHRLVDVSGCTLAVAGVTDTTAHRFVPADLSSPVAAARGIPDSAFKLLLAHQPASLPQAAAAGFDLVLSGHTHGGQFFPGTLVIGLFHPVAAGLGRQGRTKIYVSRGTGVWGPPMRLGAPNELTEIVLRRA